MYFFPKSFSKLIKQTGTVTTAVTLSSMIAPPVIEAYKPTTT